MKEGDIKYTFCPDPESFYIYEVKLVREITRWKNHWDILFTKKYLDFSASSKYSLVGKLMIVDQNFLFSTLKECISKIISRNIINKRTLIKRLMEQE